MWMLNTRRMGRSVHVAEDMSSAIKELYTNRVAEGCIPALPREGLWGDQRHGGSHQPGHVGAKGQQNPRRAQCK